MRNSLITSLLRCPVCRSDFQLRDDALRCEGGHSFQWRNNIIDFSRTAAPSQLQERSKNSFGIEWNEILPHARMVGRRK